MGLPDKAVAESRERVRAALTALGIALPAKRITVNLSPADMMKEGSHYDLAVALGVLVALGVIDQQDVASFIVLGELSLDARLTPVTGILPAAIEAAARGKGLICPEKSGPEAAWAEGIRILAAPDLLQLINHLKGRTLLAEPRAHIVSESPTTLDLSDIKGQEMAKRALEIAAAGGHNLLMQGSPGSGKSMLAARMVSILPPLTPREALDVTMIHSLSGQLPEGRLIQHRPFRDPHHSASLPALVGGGLKAKPGEISLAHHGVLFLDELPEFQRGVLETLRQPLEVGHVVIARANAHVTYPARFQLVAAMNPCRCGYVDDPDRACRRVPACAQEYQSRLSGPLLDRIDLNVFVPAVRPLELSSAHQGESSKIVAQRVLTARRRQYKRAQDILQDDSVISNAWLSNVHLDHLIPLEAESRALIEQAISKFKLSARGYYRILRVAQTIADLEGVEHVRAPHLAEAITFRHSSFAA